MSARRMILQFMGMVGVGFLVAGLIPAAGTPPAAAQTAEDTYQVRTYVPLTKEFFEAMEKLSRDNATTYGDLQEPLLQQIAVASQFVVKTNLTLIKQNERIIQLLEELNRKRLLQEK